MAEDVTPQQMQGLVGQEIGVSDWVVVDQENIDLFAEATGDHQFIHVDPERAARTPFGGTIAHGFLTLSLFPRLYAASTAPKVRDVKMGVNYGGERVRFITPVPSGSKVRGRFRLSEAGGEAAGPMAAGSGIHRRDRRGERQAGAGGPLGQPVLRLNILAHASLARIMTWPLRPFLPRTPTHELLRGTHHPMRDAVIVSTARTPIGKAYRGAFNATLAPTTLVRARRQGGGRAGRDRCRE